MQNIAYVYNQENILISLYTVFCVHSVRRWNIVSKWARETDENFVVTCTVMYLQVPAFSILRCFTAKFSHAWEANSPLRA